MGDVRAERVEDELAGLRGIRISAPNFAAYGAGSMREALSGKLIHWSAPTRKYLWIDSFIILNVVQYRKERNISFLLDSK